MEAEGKSRQFPRPIVCVGGLGYSLERPGHRLSASPTACLSTAMLILHHLENSRSLRILWLLVAFLLCGVVLSSTLFYRKS